MPILSNAAHPIILRQTSPEYKKDFDKWNFCMVTPLINDHADADLSVKLGMSCWLG
jgi:hypothetical protein